MRWSRSWPASTAGRSARPLTRWHPDAEEWQDPDVPLPSSDAERRAEHEEAIADERAEVAAERRAANFEVRVEFDSHREAADFAKQAARPRACR